VLYECNWPGTGRPAPTCPVATTPQLLPVVLVSTRDREDFADLIAASPAAGFLPKNLLSGSAVLDVVPGKGC
jgi:hypothetical protein